MDAVDLLKKYNMYDDAQVECKKKKIDKAPYDMQGHHTIYCSYLLKKWIEFRDKKDKLQKIKCKEWENIPKEIKPVHSECFFVELSLEDKYCNVKCEYYKNEIKLLGDKMRELSEAQKVLDDASQHDFWYR